MSVKSELDKARKAYNTSPSYDAFVALREKEDEFFKTPEGLKKFKKDNPDDIRVGILEQIVSLKTQTNS